MQTTTNDTTTETRASLDELLLEREIQRTSERAAAEYELREDAERRVQEMDELIRRRLGAELADALQLTLNLPQTYSQAAQATFQYAGRMLALSRHGYNTLHGSTLRLYDVASNDYDRAITTREDFLDALADFPRWLEERERRAAAASKPKPAQPKHRFLPLAMATGSTVKIVTTASDSDGDTVTYTGEIDSQSSQWLLISMSDGTGQRIVNCAHILAIVPEPPKHDTGYDERDDLPEQPF